MNRSLLCIGLSVAFVGCPAVASKSLDLQNNGTGPEPRQDLTDRQEGRQPRRRHNPSPGPPSPSPDPPPSPNPSPSPDPPAPSPTGANPLGIKAASKRSDNYFLVVGDWGMSGHDAQMKVANMMKAYASKQKASGKTLLFIAALGDNFYGAGVENDAHWKRNWFDVYGPNDQSSSLHQVPWLAIMGNHDLGKSDGQCACGGLCKQFNGQRPSGTERYWMPHYYWYYEIPEVELEVVGLDMNGPEHGALGGGVAPHCGDYRSFLNKKGAESEALLQKRAHETSAKTVLIIQHYPSAGRRLLDMFRTANGNKAKALSMSGHDHVQRCDGARGSWGCDNIVSGGGGLCYHSPNHGFTAVALTDDGGYVADHTSGDVFISNTCPRSGKEDASVVVEIYENISEDLELIV